MRQQVVETRWRLKVNYQLSCPQKSLWTCFQVQHWYASLPLSGPNTRHGLNAPWLAQDPTPFLIKGQYWVILVYKCLCPCSTLGNCKHDFFICRLQRIITVWGVFCWAIDIPSDTGHFQFNTAKLYPRTNSVDYKTHSYLCFKFPKRFTREQEKCAVTWHQTRSCHWILDSFYIIKQIVKSRLIKRSKVMSY